MTPEDLQMERMAEERVCDIRHAAIGEQIGELEHHLTKLLEEFEKRIDERFRAQDRTMAATAASAEKAVNTAAAAADRAIQKQDEWQATLSDKLPRREYEAAHATLVAQMSAVTARVDTSTGRGAGMGSLVGWIFAGAMTLIAIVTIILEITNTR